MSRRRTTPDGDALGRARQEGGMEALCRAPHFGRPRAGSARENGRKLVGLLEEKEYWRAGFSTESWKLCRGSQNPIQTKFSVKLVPISVWRLFRRLGWEACSGRPARRANATSEAKFDTWKAK